MADENKITLGVKEPTLYETLKKKQDPNKAWSQKDKEAFAKGASGDYKPDYWGNLKQGLGLN